jgi:tRNA(Arg) A34 adenosine deaminase TadA
MPNHTQFLTQAIALSQKSFEAGNFPAGAVVVKDGAVLATAVSSPYPGLLHADSKAVHAAFEQYGPLEGASLYVGLQNCLMCLGVAYWGGISDIYYAVPKAKVSGEYYETYDDLSHLSERFHRKMVMHHVPELEEKALAVIRAWERKMKQLL